MACDFFHGSSIKRNPGFPCCDAGIVTVCPGVRPIDSGPWGEMGACWRLDPVTEADNEELRNKALPRPLLGRLPLTSLIKSWGRGSPRRRRVHCVQGAGEVSRGGWEGPGN